MERDGPKTVQELFDGTNPEAECAGKPKPIDHEWYVFRAEEEQPGAIQWSHIKPKRNLYVLCRACGADAIIKGCNDDEWERAVPALDGKPDRLPNNQRHRPKNIEPRRPEAWLDLTLDRYGELPDD